nr:MAG TPA: hypothetical protein [Caudoviricetes sp.]
MSIRKLPTFTKHPTQFFIVTTMAACRCAAAVLTRCLTVTVRHTTNMMPSDASA